ncbi:4-oxalocrotonate tautomerase [Lentzea xinjiangensis]|uniref:4-oxalocrotonate tautomerase n=1 Tax=Lentzea xinjiangensis TaxID=402600 RepID=A0A1H9RR62_9PSEU|nr:tautomerase family protein [Lentzea xinjiangensis]SER75282.1 4-oxalocrotonate tautomerase [Lentzea xinjiangensis]
MPHVNVKHFPAPLAQERAAELVTAITEAVTRAFGCEPGVVSIALEPVDPRAWQDEVYAPEIVERGHLLHKTPSY